MKTHEIPIHALAEADGVFFLTMAKGDRLSIATTIERLIDMLDAMDDDPDLEDDDPAEPWLGAPERHPFGGWSWETRCQRREYSQEYWSAGEHIADDREQECEDEGAQCDDEGAKTGDDEYSLGWQDEGTQEYLSTWGDYEPDLGTTEEVDQLRRLEIAAGHDYVNDGEPWLGWAESAGRGVVGPQNCVDDREHEDEREQEYDGGEEELLGESPAPILGGGSVCQWEDGWRPVPGSGVAPAMIEKAKRQRNGDIVREFVRPSSVRLLPEHAIPEIDLASLRDHYRSANERSQ